MLSNLLQEFALDRDHGRKRIVLDEAPLTENPVDHLSRMIKNSFWHSLTCRIDGDGLEIITADPKNCTGRIQPCIYVPHGEPARSLKSQLLFHSSRLLLMVRTHFQLFSLIFTHTSSLFLIHTHSNTESVQLW